MAPKDASMIRSQARVVDADRYTVHTGHKYGAHFVLYEGSPDECHSRYCVHVMGGGGGGDSWGHMKTVTRLMPVSVAHHLRGACFVSSSTRGHFRKSKSLEDVARLA